MKSSFPLYYRRGEVSETNEIYFCARGNDALCVLTTKKLLAIQLVIFNTT